METFITIYWQISMSVFAIGVVDCLFLLMAVATRGGESVLLNISEALYTAAENACTPTLFNVWIHPQSEWGRMFAFGLIAMILGAIGLGPLAILALIYYWVQQWFYLTDIRKLSRRF